MSGRAHALRWDILVCPYDGSAFDGGSGRRLRCTRGHEFPIIQGVPVLLRDDVPATLEAGRASLKAARAVAVTGNASSPSEPYLETLGISESERQSILRFSGGGAAAIDPVVQYLVGATCGRAYVSAMGKLSEYPIPEIPLPSSSGALLLEIGCNWGRWSIAAARKGYNVIAVDPQLGAVLAGRRVAAQLGLDIGFICADARHLPIAASSVDTVFSYSVLQHFSREDLVDSLSEVRRVLHYGGQAMIQMANAHGLRNRCQSARRGVRETKGFGVRYYAPAEIKALFEAQLGPTRLFADCFLGLGLQASDRAIVSRDARVAIALSEILKRVDRRIPLLTRFADSLYLRSTRSGNA